MVFSLNDISSTKKIKPIKILLHAAHKMGKSTFASQFPDVIFLPTEDGLKEIDTVSFPVSKNLADFWSAMSTLQTEEHSFKSVCVDTVDHLESIIHDQIVADYNETESKQISTISQIGYGKGSDIALEYWRKINSVFDTLVDDRGMNVILLAHSHIKRFDDPLSESYDRYEIKLDKKANKYLQEVVDIIGFAQQINNIKSEELGFNKTKKRVETVDIRRIFLHRTSAFDAGCRIPGMPQTVDLNYESLKSALDNARGIK